MSEFWVKIVNAKKKNLWYSDRIDQSFQVMRGVDTAIDKPGDGYIVVLNGHGSNIYLYKEDCVDIIEVREDKLNQLGV